MSQNGIVIVENPGDSFMRIRRSEEGPPPAMDALADAQAHTFQPNTVGELEIKIDPTSPLPTSLHVSALGSFIMLVKWIDSPDLPPGGADCKIQLAVGPGGVSIGADVSMTAEPSGAYRTLKRGHITTITGGGITLTGLQNKQVTLSLPYTL